jgi:hypothetical protein
MNTLDEMWAALAAHQPAPEYAEAWETMLKERTPYAAEAAMEAAWVAMHAAEVVAEVMAAWAAAGAASEAAWVGPAPKAAAASWVAAEEARAAQRAINAIQAARR